MKSLMKSKAPVVAVPVEGKAPVCVDGNRLRKWGKGVTIDRFETCVEGGEWYCVEQAPGGYLVEGPVNLVAERTVEIRHLHIAGHIGAIKTSCRMIAIPRSKAIKILSAWGERGRASLQKKTMLGALSATDKRTIRRAKLEDDGEAMLTVMCLVGNKKIEKRGIPVVIPEFAELSFALVYWGDANPRVTEMVTGMPVGNGATGEMAILDARTKAAKLSEDKRAAIIAKVASELVNNFNLAVAQAERLSGGVTC